MASDWLNYYDEAMRLQIAGNANASDDKYMMHLSCTDDSRVAWVGVASAIYATAKWLLD